MSERDQHNRWRCLTVGCNPRLFSEAAAAQHRAEMSHRTAKWPIRSADGKRRAKMRNRSGYYDQYNIGEKSATARGQHPGVAAASHYVAIAQDQEAGWDAHKD